MNGKSVQIPHGTINVFLTVAPTTSIPVQVPIAAVQIGAQFILAPVDNQLRLSRSMLQLRPRRLNRQ